VSNKLQWLAKRSVVAIARSKINRQNTVLDEYSTGWASMAGHLERSATIEDWLRIRGLEDGAEYCNVDGKLKYEAFDSLSYNRYKILETLKREFPEARSVAEFGSGVGRNLLFLKQQLPLVEFYGYELCEPGVQIARSAAKKFGLDVRYSRLDFVSGREEEYVFPKTDVAFTVYALEQIPVANKTAMDNILRHVTLGSIHIEPVPENYPLTFRGLVGRIDHWKVDYLRNYEANIASLDVAQIKREKLGTAHNPLMFPTLYVFQKNKP
jgi:SAM-dependent methyltransferase